MTAGTTDRGVKTNRQSAVSGQINMAGEVAILAGKRSADHELSADRVELLRSTLKSPQILSFLACAVLRIQEGVGGWKIDTGSNKVGEMLAKFNKLYNQHG